ncbi:molybdopterin synthase [Halocatena pleomorpha]|uniref:Molybdopterin synthase n=1 Tax=Halocatena pleomorpha TaxID=1785090 RepID=A0A3P3REC8_9EURY|nr:molybdopterin synthase [Halocatena pleomorpha]RRJ31704.1 molybdopterin synthase [Halocatena pleomorpha]
MHTVTVVGPHASDLVERLVGELATDGSVATVSSLPVAPAPGFEDAIGYTAVGAGVSVGRSSDGWTAYNDSDDRPVSDILDELAPNHDYCLLDGVAEVTLPTITINDADHAGESIATVTDPNDCALEPLLAAIEGTDPHETLGSLVERVKRSPHADRAGAIATFTGRVRVKNDPDDAPTKQLEFEAYEDVAAERLRTIRSELEDRDGVYDVCLHHRTGVIERGEDIVFVVVLAGHREEAFRTVQDGINRLKDEVPFFKKEVTTDDEFWVHERSQTP